ERLHGDRIALDAFAFAAQCRLYDEAQKCNQLRRMPEDLASRYFVERTPDFIESWLVFAYRRNHLSLVTSMYHGSSCRCISAIEPEGREPASFRLRLAQPGDQEFPQYRQHDRAEKQTADAGRNGSAENA